MKKRFLAIALACSGSFQALCAEELRLPVAGSGDVPSEMTLSPGEAALINLSGSLRFVRGVELELNAPAAWPQYAGSLTLSLYTREGAETAAGSVIVRGQPVYTSPLAGKIQNTYQIPLQTRHGIRATPYSVLVQEAIPVSEFPIVVSLSAASKNISAEAASMSFSLVTKPIMSDEGLVKITLQYPESSPGQPVAVLIDDSVVNRLGEEILLREGEHHISVISQDYRAENRRFLISRGKTQELLIALQDLTPALTFEAPDEAEVFLDGTAVKTAKVTVTPGRHEVKVQVSDYSLIKTINVEKGKSYRISFIADLRLTEEE